MHTFIYYAVGIYSINGIYIYMIELTQSHVGYKLRM